MNMFSKKFSKSFAILSVSFIFLSVFFSFLFVGMQSVHAVTVTTKVTTQKTDTKTSSEEMKDPLLEQVTTGQNWVVAHTPKPVIAFFKNIFVKLEVFRTGKLATVQRKHDTLQATIESKEAPKTDADGLPFETDFSSKTTIKALGNGQNPLQNGMTYVYVFLLGILIAILSTIFLFYAILVVAVLFVLKIVLRAFI